MYISWSRPTYVGTILGGINVLPPFATQALTSNALLYVNLDMTKKRSGGLLTDAIASVIVYLSKKQKKGGINEKDFYSSHTSKFKYAYQVLNIEYYLHMYVDTYIMSEYVYIYLRSEQLAMVADT